MVLFCSRINELETLKLHLNRDPITVSGFSKNLKGDIDEKRKEEREL